MKVTRRLILGIFLIVTVITVVNTVARIERERVRFHEDTRRDHDFVGRTLRAAWLDVWRFAGAARADAMTVEVNAAYPSVSVQARTTGMCVDSPWTGRERHVEGGGILLSCYPFRVPDGSHRAIELTESTAPQRRFVEISIVRHTVIGVLTVLVTGLVTALLGAHFVGRPVRALADKARRVGAGDLTGPLVLRQDDEIAELAREFNAMCERLAEAHDNADAHYQARLRAVEELRHADRLRTVGQLASGLAHELGTPLNVVLGHAGLLRGGGSTEEEVVEGARIIEEQTRRMTDLIRRLLDFARRKGPSAQPTDLVELALGTAALLGPLAQKVGVHVEVAGDGPVGALVDPGQIQQVLTNLLVNAIHAMPGGGRLAVSLGERDAAAPAEVASDARRWLFIAVEDDGVGIPTEDLARVFEPFFTTKAVGEGTGLGLSVAYTIARDHGGWITAERRPERGSRFTVYLPPAPRA